MSPGSEMITSKPRQPKVAWVMHSVFNAKFFLEPHFRMLAEEHEVLLYLRNDAPELLSQMEIPVRVVEIPIVRHVNPLADLRTLWHLYRALRRDRPDLVHSTTAKGGLIGMLAAFLARVPRRVHTFQGEVWPHFSGFKRWFFWFMDWFVVRLATEITVVSASERDFLRSEGVLAPDRGLVLGSGSICGVDLDRFCSNPDTRDGLRRELGIDPDEFVFLFLGRLQRDKGLHVLQEAFDLLRRRVDQPFRLLVVGPDEDGLGAGLKADLGDRIHVIPYTERPEDYIGASDLLLLPSFREGFGMVLIEAAAMGVPAVASRIYGISCAVADGETGLLFEVGNAQAMAEAMERLLTDTSFRQKLGEAGIRRVREEFDQKIVIEHFRQFYNEQLGQNVTGQQVSSKTQ